MTRPLALVLLMAVPLAAADSAVEIQKVPFGKTADGTPVEAYILKNGKGLSAKVMTRGATLVELHAPDRDGKLADVTLGFDDVAAYESDANQFFGCTTGRVCNRIAKGKFTLNGKTYTLAVNNEPNHLHGGKTRSFDKVVWKAEPSRTADAARVKFTYTSPDGEEGYPGTVHVSVTYSVTTANEIALEYEAKSEADTPFNITNHAYWNLAGEGSETVLDHHLLVNADSYTPTDDTLIPTGKIEPLRGTPLDFTKSTRVGDRIAQLDQTAAIGYDHNFVLSAPKPDNGSLRLAAELYEPKSGRLMTVTTTEPGVQVYSGNFLKGQKGKGGKVYKHRSALCLETQHFPDSVNHKEFPSTILSPGKTFTSATVYAFSVK